MAKPSLSGTLGEWPEELHLFEEDEHLQRLGHTYGGLD